MLNKTTGINALIITAGFTALSTSAIAQTEQERRLQAQTSEVWEPVPEVVNAPANKPPSDALVLIGNTASASLWEGVKDSAMPWHYQNGEMTVKAGTGDVKTKRSFCDVQLHVEWQTPVEVEGMLGQQRNNSGLFFQQRYEVQILDSFNNKTYPNGQAASVYKQSIPLVNAMRAPGQWQHYDIIYRAPRFNGEALMQPAFITVIHNGVLVQNHVEVKGATQWIGAPSYKVHGCEPLQLQDHGNSVKFRNMWVREL